MLPLTNARFRRSRERGSNSRPQDYKSSALPTELSRREIKGRPYFSGCWLFPSRHDSRPFWGVVFAVAGDAAAHHHHVGNSRHDDRFAYRILARLAGCDFLVYWHLRHGLKAGLACLLWRPRSVFQY